MTIRIHVDGPDAVGKTPMVQQLAKELRAEGLKVVTVKEPYTNGLKTAEEYHADRVANWDPHEEADVVLSDRSVLAMLVENEPVREHLHRASKIFMTGHFFVIVPGTVGYYKQCEARAKAKDEIESGDYAFLCEDYWHCEDMLLAALVLQANSYEDGLAQLRKNVREVLGL